MVTTFRRSAKPGSGNQKNPRTELVTFALFINPLNDKKEELMVVNRGAGLLPHSALYRNPRL